MKKPVQKTAPARSKPAPVKVKKVVAASPAGQPATPGKPVSVAAKKAAVTKPVLKPVVKPPNAGAVKPAPVAVKKAAVVTKQVANTTGAKPLPPMAVKPAPVAAKKKAVAPPVPAAKTAPRRNKAVTPEQLRGDKRKFYDALINLRGHITSQYRDLSASSLASTKQAGEELADVGSDNFNRDLGLAMLTEDNHKLAQIEEAIERVLHDEYGTCADCGKMIAEARLLAIPFTTVCVDCKTRREDNEKYNPGGHFDEEPLFGADGDETVDAGAAEDEDEGEEAPAAKGEKNAKAAKKKVQSEEETAEEDDDEEA